jgi:hypothetical protein
MRAPEAVGIAGGSQSKRWIGTPAIAVHVVMRARCQRGVRCFRTHGAARHDFARDMLTETLDPQFGPWPADAGDPGEDRIMLAIQYATAIIAALAAGLLSLVH